MSSSDRSCDTQHSGRVALSRTPEPSSTSVGGGSLRLRGLPALADIGQLTVGDDRAAATVFVLPVDFERSSIGGEFYVGLVGEPAELSHGDGEVAHCGFDAFSGHTIPRGG